MEEWKEYKLGELITLNSGGTPDKNNKSYWDGEIPWISAKFMYDDYLYSSELKISQDGLTSGSRLAPKGSILLLTRGSGLFNRIPVCYTMRDLAYNQDVKCIESKNKELVSTEYLFYWFMGNKDSISAILETTGIGAGKIDTNRLKNIRISLPPKEYQQILIGFAESIMHKIEVNRRINENLEQQAQALFKSWFVDFEPFKDQPFVESELGMIPQGWTVVSYKDVCANITDGVHNTVKDDPRGEYYLLSCKNIKGGTVSVGDNERRIDKQTFEKLRKRTKLQKGDILLSSVGTIGEMVFLNEEPDYYEFQRSVAIIKPDEDYIDAAFLFYSMKNQKDAIVHSAHGAVQQCLFISDVSSFVTIYPPRDIMGRYSSIAMKIQDEKTKNEQESRRLAELRDALLPKLMSGELKVENVTFLEKCLRQKK